MAKYLVIVESPAKVKTIKKFLGSNYEVLASNGHVRDVPRRQLGIDVEHDISMLKVYELYKSSRNASNDTFLNTPTPSGSQYCLYFFNLKTLIPIVFHSNSYSCKISVLPLNSSYNQCNNSDISAFPKSE